MADVGSPALSDSAAAASHEDADESVQLGRQVLAGGAATGSPTSTGELANVPDGDADGSASSDDEIIHNIAGRLMPYSNSLPPKMHRA